MAELNIVDTGPAGAVGQITTPFLQTLVPGYSYGMGNGYFEFGSGTPGSLPFRVDQSGNITGASINPTNSVGLQPSADQSGLTDAAAIAALINLGVTKVTLGPGTFYVSLSAPFALSTPSSWIQGSGPGVTSLTIVGTSTAAYLFNVTANGCQISDLRIVGASTTVTSNPVMNAIEVTGAQRFHVSNIQFQYINGWCLETLCTSTLATYALQAHDLIGLNCDGGVHAKAVSGVGYGGQHSYANMNFQQMGVGSSGLDVFLFEDVEDIQGVNFNTSISDASTASSMHIKGHCATIYLANMDLGTFPNGSGTNYVWLIEDGTNGSPQDIRVANAVGQQGTYGLRITGGANRVTFLNFRAFNNYAHGISIEGTGANINFFGLDCSVNGNGATGTNYDVNWSGTATGTIELATLSSPVVSTGTIGVQNPAFYASGNSAIARNWTCNGSGTTANNVFPTGAESPGIAQNITPWNPRGSATVAVPASGTAVSKSGADRWFYIATGAGTTTMAVNGATSLTVTLPASATTPVFVPAGATMTPTYTNAPTWVVYAN